MSKNKNINSKTDLYCIFGNPVAHSKSPAVHNALFKEKNIDAVYLAFNINSIENGISAIREFDIKGVSITIPFKEKVIKYLDYIDDYAKSIGAVNTILNKQGKLTGYNTDWKGGVEPLKKYDITDKNVGIIGAGGAAHAIAFGIKKNKGNLTIINRSRRSGEKLSSLFDSDFLDINKIEKDAFDIIINTTPVGMTPGIDNTPIKKELLNNKMVVMDIIYNPIETRLIKEAKEIGCATIDGLSMFLNQGAEQFEIWTGIKPSIKLMRDILMEDQQL
jgi:shikimate dehydrogenase